MSPICVVIPGPFVIVFSEPIPSHLLTPFASGLGNNLADSVTGRVRRVVEKVWAPRKGHSKRM